MSHYSGLYRASNSSDEESNEVINSDSDSDNEDSEEQSYYSASSFSGVHISQINKKSRQPEKPGINLSTEETIFKKRRQVNVSNVQTKGRERSKIISSLKSSTSSNEEKTLNIFYAPDNNQETTNILYGPDTGEDDSETETTSEEDEGEEEEETSPNLPNFKENSISKKSVVASEESNISYGVEEPQNISYGVDESHNISYGVDSSNSTNISYGVDSNHQENKGENIMYTVDDTSNNSTNEPKLTIEQKAKKNNLKKARMRSKSTKTFPEPKSSHPSTNVSDVIKEDKTDNIESTNISYGVDSSTTQNLTPSLKEEQTNISYDADSSNSNAQNISYGVESEDSAHSNSNISYGVDNHSPNEVTNVSYGVDSSITTVKPLKSSGKTTSTPNIVYGVNITSSVESTSPENTKRKRRLSKKSSKVKLTDTNDSPNVSYGIEDTHPKRSHTRSSKKKKDENVMEKRSKRKKRSAPEVQVVEHTSDIKNPNSSGEVSAIKGPSGRILQSSLSLAESAELKLLGGRNRSSVILETPVDKEKKRDLNKSVPIRSDKLGMKECHWNTEFQNALDMDEGKEKWEKLAHLARDFVYCSKTYGKIIISEYYLPEEEKTIKSSDAGGIAGGSKYICSNIFFKFALDTDLLAGTRAAKGLDESRLPPLWMYGGSERNDYAAMKSSKNDMIGLMSYYNSKIPGLCFPLMSLIDYRGFRLIAMSILPITKGSIKYGSADGGKVVHKDIKELNQKMKEVAERLNLKGHKTGLQKVTIYGPGDIEGHLGKDDKFYVLDFGRVFPPEAPDPPGSRKIFYCLLRPEFVRAYHTPLSSDAFSCWGKIGSPIHNAEVIEATKYLYEDVIPKFAIELAQREGENEIRLTELIHASGINCRHFGRVRRAVPLKHTRIQELLLNEMLGRTLTAVLRQLLRFEMQKTRIASQEPYKILVLDFFNSLLIPRKPSYSKSYSSPKPGVYRAPALRDVDNTSYLLYHKFWTRDLKHWLNDKFEYGLTDEEMDENYDLRNGFDMEKLILRICSQSGIKLSKHALAEYRNSRDNFKLLNFDLRKMSAKVRHLNVIDEAEGNLLYIEASSAQGRSGLWEATNQMYARAVSSNTNNPQAYVRWGTILMEQSARINLDLPDARAEYEKLLESARDKFQVALKIDNKMPFAYFELAITILEQAVTMQLFRSSDTIAISLWMIVQAQEYLKKAFFTENASRSLLFPTLLERADEIYQLAKSTEKSTKMNVLYLKAFYMIHCAITTAPFVPEASVFLSAAVIMKCFLSYSTEFSQRCPKFLYSLAGSYLESAFLTHPSCSDGDVIYYQRKSNYQRKVTNTSEILPNYSDNKRDIEGNNDIVLIYEKKANSSDSTICTYLCNEEIAVPKDTPLHMLPVITKDPSNDYHATIGINRILHVLGNDTVTSNLDFCAYYSFNGQSACKQLKEDNIVYSFHKSSWIFLLNHSGFHHFLLTHLHIRYSKAANENECPPKQILLYGTVNEDIIYSSPEEIQTKVTNNDSDLVFIYNAELDINLGAFESRIRQTVPVKYLILVFIPPSNSTRNLILSSISLRGHQCYTTERKDVGLSSEDIKKLKPKLRTSKEESFLGKSFDESAAPRQLKLSNAPLKPKNGLGWSDKRHSPRLNIGDDRKVVKLIHKRFILKHEKGVPLNPDCPHVCQAEQPFDLKQYDEKGNPTYTSNSVSTDSTPVTDLCPMVLWVDGNHNSTQNKTLYQESKAICANLIIVKVNSLSHAKKWVNTQIDYNSATTKLVQKLIRKKIFRIIVSRNLPSDEGTATAQQFIDWVKQTLLAEDWSAVPVLIIDENEEPIDQVENKDEKIYSTSSSKSIQEFLCYDPQFFPKFGRSRNNSSLPDTSLLLTQPSIENLLNIVLTDFLYFEIRIIGIEKGGNIAIGISNRSFPLHGSLPGTLPDSLAYHSESGLLYCGNSYKPYHFANGQAHPFGDGDVIGCGFNTRTHQVFWTKNGKYLGTAEQSRSKFAYLAGLKLFPTVGITKGGTFSANFGTEPFLFIYSKLFDEQMNQSAPKQMTSDQKMSDIFPYYDVILEESLKEHRDSLIIVSTLARYSRSFNVLLRAHFKFQRSRQLRFSDSSFSYLTINLKNSELATNLSVSYLFSLLNEPKYVMLQNCTKITDELFSVLQNSQSVEELNLAGVSLTDAAATAIEERFVNLNSIHFWPGISEKALLSLSSFSSLTSINLSDCKNVNDLVVHQILKPQRNRYLLSLNFSNCVEITDKSITQLYKSSSANYLQSLIFDYCSKISNNSLLKVVKTCVSLQTFSIASNPNECNILDNTVIELANLRGPIIRSLNFARCDKLTTESISAIGKNCANMTELNISHCKQVDPTGLHDIARGCSKLVHLDLFNTNLTDDVLFEFCKNCPNLKFLSIQRTNVSPKSIVPCFKYLHKLETLILKENSLSDALLLSIANNELPALITLDISSSPTNLSTDTLKFLKARRSSMKLITERLV